MNFHHQTDSLYRYPTFNADTLITDVFLSTYYFNSSYKKLEKIKIEKRKRDNLKLVLIKNFKLFTKILFLFSFESF